MTARSAPRWVQRWLPRVVLTDEAFEARHRVLRVVLWLHIPLVVAVAGYTTMTSKHSTGNSHQGMATGGGPDSHLIVTWAFVAAAVVAGVLVPRMRTNRSRALMVSLGLLMCADALVHGSGGQTDLHFDFFVVLAAISLYQDLAVFVLAIATVGIHHGVIGAIAPTMVYSSPGALAHPVWYALMHATFVLAMSAAQIVYWKFTENAQTALRAQTDEATRLALVATYTDNGVVITTPTGVIEWVNEPFTRMTGYSAAEAVGRNRVHLFDGREGEAEFLQALFADVSKGVDAEFLTRDRHGREYWLNLEVRPIFEDGAVVRLVGVERDVTARRSTEEHERTASRRAAALAAQLTVEKAVLSGVISTIPHLVYWKDADRRYAGANEAFLAWVGRPEAAVLGRTEEELDATDVSAHLLAIEEEMQNSGGAVIDRNVVVTRSDDTICSLLISVLPQPAFAGGGVIGVAADVTHLTELEKQLAQAHRLEAIGQLAAGVAHEINTPVQFVSDNTRFVAEAVAGLVPALTALSSAAAAAPSDPASDTLAVAVRDALDGIDLGFLAAEVPLALDESLEGLGRIAQIVSAMKEFSHPGQAKSAADLNRAVQSTVQVSRNEWKYIAALEIDLDPDVGLIDCHQGEIKQVVLNLIVNAAHAIQERRASVGDNAMGTISVATARHGDEVEITVADDGIGMDPDTQKRIFDPFFTTKDVGKGTGQGLNLAHSAVGRHHGTIAVDSARGVGTTFRVTLPAPREPMDDPRRELLVLHEEGSR
jgi:PAS domain S-box-containing protein